MNLQEVMDKLESLGTEQTRKTYRRHGAGEKLFGVLFADLKALAKKIKCDHELACQLWETENVDARSLATMIIDPKKLDERTTYKWISKVDYHALAGLLSGCIAQSDFTSTVISDWLDSENEYVRQCGYDTLSNLLKENKNLSTHQCRTLLDKIEKEIHAAPNRVRYSINNALISIGIYKPELLDAALSAADRIGKVDIDHGDTSCKTPDARAYIEKALSRKGKVKAPIC